MAGALIRWIENKPVKEILLSQPAVVNMTTGNELGRFMKFCSVGLTGVIINMGLLWFFTDFARLYYLLSSVIAIEASILSNFLLNDKLDFCGYQHSEFSHNPVPEVERRLLHWHGHKSGIAPGPDRKIRCLLPYLEPFRHRMRYYVQLLLGEEICLEAMYVNVSVVIPAYNERLNLERLVDEVSSSLRDCCDAFRIIFVYEGNDSGQKLLKEMGKNYQFIKVDYSARPLGIGGALKKGFHQIPEGTTHVLTMDADLSHDPRDISRLIKASDTADIVVGSRYVAGGGFDQMPLVQKAISQFANGTISGIFGINVKDLSSNYRLYDVKAIRAIRDSTTSNDYGFFPESMIVASRRAYEIREVPITYYRRERGKSKLNLYKTGIAYIRLVLRLYFL